MNTRKVHMLALYHSKFPHRRMGEFCRFTMDVPRGVDPLEHWDVSFLRSIEGRDSRGRSFMGLVVEFDPENPPKVSGTQITDEEMGVRDHTRIRRRNRFPRPVRIKKVR